MTMIQMYDPKREYNEHKQAIDQAIHKVLDDGLFINGPDVKLLEERLARYVGVKHCMGVSNGTDALKIALLALGVKPGDEVITTAHTWISTVEVISLISAVPVFVDIREDTFCMNPTGLESAITERTRCIIPVSLYGRCVGYNMINAIASKYNVPVIEDGAQSFGALYNGKRSCSLTTIGTTSFFPSKPLGCYGDGGACFTNDDTLAERMRCIRNHGALVRFNHTMIGMNGRLDTIQAAILNTKLDWFDETLVNRQNCARRYLLELSCLEDNGFIKLPEGDPGVSAWAQFSILMVHGDRDRMVEHLKQHNINAAIFYPKPLHTQPCFKYLNYCVGDLPNTESVCDQVFNLPCYGDLMENEINHIIKTVISFFQ